MAPRVELWLEELAAVQAVAPGGVWVSARRRSGCQACAARQGCGQGVLERVLNRPSRLWLAVPEQLAMPAVGDRVRLGVPAGAVLRASLVLYLSPLVGLLAGALAGYSLGFADPSQVVLALSGMGLGIVVSGWLIRALVPVLEPRLLAVLPPDAAATASAEPVRILESAP